MLVVFSVLSPFYSGFSVRDEVRFTRAKILFTFEMCVFISNILDLAQKKWFRYDATIQSPKLFGITKDP